jgi:hypothetical protein
MTFNRIYSQIEWLHITRFLILFYNLWPLIILLIARSEISMPHKTMGALLSCSFINGMTIVNIKNKNKPLMIIEVGY